MGAVVAGIDTLAVARAAELLSGARYAVALCGAGISKESGIPTFRGEGGLWTTRGEPPAAQYDSFISDPKGWWERRLAQASDASANPFASALEAAAPNDGHHALAALEAMGILGHVITQNIDDLHRRAGQRSLTEIHGNRHWLRCVACEARWPRDEFPVDPQQLPPRCARPGCGGVVKSDTVMFGEPIPASARERCEAETARADLFLAVGTSAQVFPAAYYPRHAVRRGVPLIEINPEPTPLSALAAVVLRASSGAALRELVAAVRGRRAG